MKYLMAHTRIFFFRSSSSVCGEFFLSFLEPELLNIVLGKQGSAVVTYTGIKCICYVLQNSGQVIRILCFSV